MLERGLLPDFSAAALNQTHALTLPATARGPDIRDLRSDFSSVAEGQDRLALIVDTTAES